MRVFYVLAIVALGMPIGASAGDANDQRQNPYFKELDKSSKSARRDLERSMQGSGMTQKQQRETLEIYDKHLRNAKNQAERYGN